MRRSWPYLADKIHERLTLMGNEKVLDITVLKVGAAFFRYFSCLLRETADPSIICG